MRRIVDLTLTIDNTMPGVSVTSTKTVESDGWNATTLSLYSHCGTHMDAPCHFLNGQASIDQQDLSACIGPARVINLAPIAPRETITVNSLGPLASQISAGDRLLFRTDWYRRYGTPAYRNELPRIFLELAAWLVERQVALVGVEPPSVADVNDRRELTAVHHVLLGGNVVIVEGLAHLDQLTASQVHFIAMPLRH